MKRRGIFTFLISTCIFGMALTACGEKGEQGPIGPQGEQGQQGEPGADGTALLTGHGVPNNNLGNNGDSYIDMDTWDYYVKANNVWTKQGNIKGGDGDAGKSAYEAYCEAHPEYTGTEEEWINDLINGNLATEKATVTFDSQSGSAVAPQQVAHGEKATRPSDPTKQNYAFSGWYFLEGSEFHPWLFDAYSVTRDITLYAKWESIDKLNAFTISYTDSSNGDIYYVVSNNEGSSLVLTTIEPNKLNPSESKNYYFSFRENENSKGVEELSSIDEKASYYIYNLGSEKYVTPDSGGNALLLTSNLADAITFDLRGNNSLISHTESNTTKYWTANNTDILFKTDANNSRPVKMIIGDAIIETSKKVPSYKLLTYRDADGVQDGDTIIIAYAGSDYVACLGTQYWYGYTTDVIVMPSINDFMDYPNIMELSVNESASNNNYYTLFNSKFNNGEGCYLCIDNSSGSLSIKTSLENNGREDWYFSFENISQAIIHTRSPLRYLAFDLEIGGFQCSTTIPGNLPTSELICGNVYKKTYGLGTINISHSIQMD